MKLRKILITGSRRWTDKDKILEVISEELSLVVRGDADVLLVIHGDHYSGADRIAEQVCWEYNVYSAKVPARWAAGKVAGPIRNRIMAALMPDKAYAFVMPDSRGTLDCIHACEKLGIPVEKIEV